MSDNMKERVIVCFGDSNTHGYDAKANGRYPHSVRWTGRLQQLLGDKFLVREAGMSGRTTVFEDPLFEGLNGFSAIYPTLMTHAPVELLVVMLGTNDSKARFAVTPDNIAKGMCRLIEKAMMCKEAWQGKPKVLLIAPPPIRPEYAMSRVAGEMGAGCAEKSKALGALYKELAAKLDIAFWDAAELGADVMNDLDFMHLTAEAHAALADVVAAKVRELCPE